MVDSSVRVRRRSGPHVAHRGLDTLCTNRFCTTRRGDVLHVAHDLRPDEICDDLAELLATELDDAGILRGQPEFEAVFTGVVRSTVEGDDAAWLRFYRNTLVRLEHGTAAFAPVHEHAASLVVGSQILDLGSCFGFFPLRMAAAGLTVTASDLSAPTMELLDRMCVGLRRPVADARPAMRPTCRCPTAPPTRSPCCTCSSTSMRRPPTAVLDEALRLARRRVVVAVPFEDVPRACYGHVQRFDVDRTARHGRRQAVT